MALTYPWLYKGAFVVGIGLLTLASGLGLLFDVADGVLLLGHLFLGEDPPPEPYPDCGLSEEESDLSFGCEETSCL